MGCEEITSYEQPNLMYVKALLHMTVTKDVPFSTHKDEFCLVTSLNEDSALFLISISSKVEETYIQ